MMERPRGTVRKESTKKRCRSGCWTCRTRKIKCDEFRPACTTCRRLNLTCRYGVKLLWQDEAASRGISLGRSGVRQRLRLCDNSPEYGNHDIPKAEFLPKVDQKFAPCAHTEQWMFLNTSTKDFDEDSNGDEELKLLEESKLNSPGYTTSKPTGRRDFKYMIQGPQTGQCSGTRFDPLGHTEETSRAPHTSIFCGPRVSSYPLADLIPHSPAIFSLSSTERYLLDYFENKIVRWCPGYGTRYPFRAIVLRLTLGTCSTMLLSAVLAVSANQLRILEDLRFEKQTWHYRGKSLKLMQNKFERCQREQDWSDWEDIFATVVLMCFFDVSDQCKPIWRSHLTFARNLRSWPERFSNVLSLDQRQLFDFFSSYFSSHEVMARTAADLDQPLDYNNFWVPPRTDLADIDMSCGTSYELLSLISSISDLGMQQSRLLEESVPGISGSQCTKTQQAEIDRQRDNIERKLHCLKQKPTRRPWDTGKLVTSREELHAVAESKRLSALLYLYFRLDSATPDQQHISRITSQILALLPQIGFKTNTILWPLFIVSVMGVQPEIDADKVQLLRHFHNLQITRQLGNVKRARIIAETTWRYRELRRPNHFNWENLQEIIRKTGGEISLM